MARCGDVYENKVTGERGVVPRGTEDNDGQPTRVHLIVQPRGAVAGEHIHPRIREGFRVISGRTGTRVDEVEWTLTAGEEAVAVPGTWHDFWNPGEVDARVLHELSPLDPRFEQMTGTMYGLANAGKTSAKGMPNLLQRVMLLGPPGRVRGYRGIYPGYGHPRGRITPGSKCARGRRAGTTGPE